MKTKYLLLTVEIIIHASLCERQSITTFYCSLNEMLHLLISPVGQLEADIFVSPQQSTVKELHTHLWTSHCNSEKLQLPTSSSVSSMRRSQSAVEATADYLGTRVARLSYLNPSEANRNIFIYRDPKR